MADNFTINTPAGNRTVRSRDTGTDIQSQKVDVAQFDDAITPADDDTNDARGVVIAREQVYDTQAGTWHRAEGGREIAAASFLASAARTATTASTTISTRGARGFFLHFQVSSAPGSGGDLTLVPGTLSPSGDVLGITGSRLTVQRSLGAVNWFFAGYPGMTESTISTRNFWTPCIAPGPRFALTVVHSDSQSWTYKCDLILLP